MRWASSFCIRKRSSISCGKSGSFVTEGLPDEDEGDDGLAAGVEPEGVQGIQRLLGGLVERQVEQEAAVVLAAALVHELVGVLMFVEAVKAVVQRQVGAELAQAGGAVLAAAGVLPPGEQQDDGPPAPPPAE